MGLPIAEFVNLGFSLAKELFPEGFKESQIRLGPTVVTDVVADTAETTWETSVYREVFPYDDEDERKKMDFDTAQRSFLLNPTDYPTGAKFNQNGEIDCDGITWQIYRTELAPGNAVVIFHAHA